MNNAEPKFFFIRALEHTLQNEGGFTNSPDDPGGPTKFGITQETLSIWLKKPASALDVSSLTKVDASMIYEGNYWKPLGCDKIKQFAIAAALFDMGVLFGVQVSATLAQRAVIDCGLTQVLPDGHIGPMSIDAFNIVGPANFLTAFRTQLLEKVADVVQKRPRSLVFQSGWKNRIDRLPLLA